MIEQPFTQFYRSRLRLSNPISQRPAVAFAERFDIVNCAVALPEERFMIRWNYTLPALVFAFFAVGCTNTVPNPPPTTPGLAKAAPVLTQEEAEIQANRAQLSPEDRVLVEAQEWCVVFN